MESVVKKLTLKDGGTHYFLEGYVDKVKANLLIDTGAMFTLLSDRFIGFGLHFKKHKWLESCNVEGLSKSEISKVIHINNLWVGDYEFSGGYTVVNLSNIDRHYVSEEAPFLIDGILGNDILSQIGFWKSFTHHIPSRNV